MRNSILVIDDDLNTISFISLILEQENYEVLATIDIEEGIKYFETNHPAVIILDLEMPEVHGLKVLKRIKSGLDKDFSVIIMTGYGHDANVKACYEQGVYAFLSKPVRLVELKGLVRNALLWEEYKQSLSEHKEQLEKLVLKRTDSMTREIELRKETELSLVQANRIKDRILSILSWDLRSPLSNVVMNLRYLCDNTKESCPEEVYQQMFDTYIEARNACQLTENIFLWARCEKGEIVCNLETCNLNSIMKDTLLFYSNSIESKSLNLNVSIDDSVEVTADRKVAYTIIQNIVSNAIKYSHPNGIVEIAVTQDKNKIALRIVDNGIGIAEDIMPDIMNIAKPVAMPGTANEKGSGLGLTISKELAKIIGAEISVESKINRGTAVTVIFPKA